MTAPMPGVIRACLTSLSSSPLLKSLAVLALGVILSTGAEAQVLTNGNFETCLTGWTASGTSQVDCLTSVQLGGHPQAPGAGTQFALLCTGPGDLGGTNLYTDGNGTGSSRQDRDRVYLEQSFTISAPAVIAFDWAYLSDEDNRNQRYDDFFLVTLTGGEPISNPACSALETSNVLHCGSSDKQGNANWSGFDDVVRYDAVNYVVNKTGSPIHLCDFQASDGQPSTGGGSTQWRSFSAALTPPAPSTTYTIRFGVADQNDRIITSGLAIDNVRLLDLLDLTITKSDGLSAVTPSQAITYTITVGNLGPEDAVDAVVTDTFSADLTSVSWTCAATGSATCTAAGAGNISDTVAVPIGDTLTYTVAATVSAGATGSIANTATVVTTGNQADTDPSNNSATDIDGVLSSTIAQLSTTSGASVIQKSGGLSFQIKNNQRASVNGTASRVAYAGNTDEAGSNSDAGSEIFVWDTGTSTLTQITDVTAPLQFDHASLPDLSASGDWMAFVSSADLLPGGNADGNREIFRYYFPTAALSQLTTTSSCSSDSPKINDAGGVAFTTTCGAALITGYNVDGNQELVATDGFGTFVGRETTGCLTRDPSLATASGNRWIGAISNCNIIGGNGDGSDEVIAWNFQSDSYLQITSGALGVNNESVATDASGSTFVFVTNGAPTGSNAESNLEVYSYNRGTSLFTQRTDTGATSFHLFVDVNAGNTYIGYEMIDALTGNLEIKTQALSLPGVENTLMVTPATTGAFPAITTQASGDPVVYFVTTSNASGNNADGNAEIYYALP